MTVPFPQYVSLWRERWGLTPERASMILGTLPHNIDRAEAGTLHPARQKMLLERLHHAHRMMATARCVVGRVRLKPEALPR